MGNIVWSAEKGWHDGPPAKVGLDGKGRLVIEPMTPEERATELGTEHGRKAGEAWWARKPGFLLACDPAEVKAWRDSLPTPDPSGDYDIAQELDGCGDRWENLIDAYSAAFTAAVEAVVIEGVEK